MKLFILVVAISLLFSANVFASMSSNENMDLYEQRYKEEFKPPKTTCGDGLCEGTEFQACPQDCKNESQVHQPEKAKINVPKVLVLASIFGIAALAVLFYIFKKKKNENFNSYDSMPWMFLGVSKEY